MFGEDKNQAVVDAVEVEVTVKITF